MFPFCLWSTAHSLFSGCCGQQRLYIQVLPTAINEGCCWTPSKLSFSPQAWVSSCVQTILHELMPQFLSPSQQHNAGDSGPELEPPEEEGDRSTGQRSQGRNAPVLWCPSQWLLPGAGGKTDWKLKSLRSGQGSVALARLILLTVALSATEKD